MTNEYIPLSVTTCAQASEIHHTKALGGVIADYTPEGEVLTVWARDNDGSVGAQRIERFSNQPPTLVEYATINFDSNGEVVRYTGSYLTPTLPAKGIRKFIERSRRRTHVRAEAQATVTRLVEFVFSNLDAES